MKFSGKLKDLGKHIMSEMTQTQKEKYVFFLYVDVSSYYFDV